VNDSLAAGRLNLQGAGPITIRASAWAAFVIRNLIAKQAI